MRAPIDNRIAPKYYPPKANEDLRNLHKAVIETNGADHHKISVLYYILLEFDASTKKREHSCAFAREAFLPEKYQIYMKGLWHLDRLEFEVCLLHPICARANRQQLALQYLTHPSLIPTFADEILDALVRTSSNDLSLALAYYHTVQPVLTNPSAIECLFSAIARTSVTEAFYFCRGQTEYTRHHMFEMLVSLVLNNSPANTVADRCVELVNLPLSKEEDIWLEEYLLQGEGRGLKKGKDLVMMRKIGTGNFTESLALKGISSRVIGGLDWKVILEGVEDGLGPRSSV